MRWKWLLRSLLLISLLAIAVMAFLLYMTKDEINANFNTIDQELNSLVASDKLAGFGVAVFSTDTVYHIAGYGQASKEKQTPYTANTQQYIASVSKSVIGVALMQAVEQGLLTLDENVNTYLPFEVTNPSFPNQVITLRQLATHTSSLDYNEAVVESLYIPEANKQASLDGFMRAYFADHYYGEVAFTNKAPGSAFNYSNIGPSLIAYAIERSSGMTFSTFTERHIFVPLAMKQTSWFALSLDTSLHTHYYEPLPDDLKLVQSDGVILYPSRDLITTVADLTIFCQALLRKDSRLLSPASYNTLWRPQLEASVENPVCDNSGLLFFIDRNQYGITYSLTGMNGGDYCIRTMMWFDPHTEIGYLLLSNTGGSEQNRVRFIWAIQALVSLGDHIVEQQAGDSVSKWLAGKYHNWYSRIYGVF